MIVTNDMIKQKMSNLSNKGNKIGREINAGNLIRLKNGLYETDRRVPGHLLACAIYGPSYLSFDYALSFYGLIPERVVNYTSATFGKKKKRNYENYFGTFVYRDVPENVYHMGVDLIEEGNYSYQIATKEKALCDKLYTLKPVKNLNEIGILLFNDLRIDEEEFKTLNGDAISEIASNYRSKNVNLLAAYVRRQKDE